MMHTISHRASRIITFLVFALFLLPISCNKEDSKPEIKIETNLVTEVSQTYGIASGTIVYLGGEVINEHGFCYSETESPTILDQVTKLGERSTLGSFSDTLSGLINNTTYYYRAYAKLGDNFHYYNQKSFTTAPPSIPVVTTKSISRITMDSAYCGGEVLSDGGAAVTARGVCWSTTQSPQVNDSHSIDGEGLGAFSSTLDGLSCGVTYYVKAYATNSSGTGYGEQVSFTTAECNLDKPEISTSLVSSITETGASCGGNVTNEGGTSVTDKGVCWSTNQNPTISDSFSSDGSGSGSYTSALTGLSSCTKYYVRAYATNSAGTNYGEQVEFTSRGCTSVSDIDGNIYQIVTIGDQVWMQENLKVVHFPDGSAIPLVEGAAEWGELTATEKAYCLYENDPGNKDEYGVLYTWAAAMNGEESSSTNPGRVQGVCPSGWHLPGRAEWKQLEMFLGMSQASADSIGWRGTDEGGKLKEAGFTHWDSPNTGATNSSGFTALPAGYRYEHGEFSNIGFAIGFWTSEEYDTSTAWIRYLDAIRSDTHQNNNDKNFGFSIRCVQD